MYYYLNKRGVKFYTPSFLLAKIRARTLKTFKVYQEK